MYNSNGIIGFRYRASSYARDVWDTYLYEKNLQGDIIAVYDGNGNKKISYAYDAWGNFTTTYHNGASASTLNNPYTYRSYYYDKDLRLYYLNSRYYDSNTGRFINADGQLNTGTILGYNLFAYCENNPIMRIDPYGDSFLGAIAVALGKAATAAIGAVTITSLIMLATEVVSDAIEATTNVVRSITKARDKSRAEEKEKNEPIPVQDQTVIYRYGGTNPGNLTPKAKDKYSGLSFSTFPMPGAAMTTTTIETLNATGVVSAVQDGPNHVSVKPVGATMEDWINAGSSSIWTQAVKSVVIKWDRGY